VETTNVRIINEDKCPLCGSELSKIKFREIEAKLRSEGQKQAAEIAKAGMAEKQRLEQQFKLDLEKQKQAVEKKVKQESDQQLKLIAVERDQTAKKLKAAEEREAAVRKQAASEIAKQKQAAEKKANEEAEGQIKKATAERDQAAKKLKEAEAREAASKKQIQQDAELLRRKELNQQRQALEKDRDTALVKQQAEFNRQKEALQKKVKTVEQQLMKKTANELGDRAEIDLLDNLRASFPDDRILPIPKGQAGADIVHEVLYKGEPCGKIVIDSKNRQTWQNSYVTKLRQDKVEARAEHAILATTVFPAGEKELFIESAVIIISPARVVHIIHLLREAILAMHLKGLSLNERAGKITRLYALITSDAYSQKFAEAGRLTRDILELDVQEKKDHDNVWRKRGTYATRLQNVLREVKTEVAAVIEGGGDEAAPRAFPAKSTGDNQPGGAKTEEIAKWSKR